MRGYAKIKGNNSFSQNSKVRNEYPFLDVDFDDALDVYSSKPQENDQTQKPNIIIKDDKNKKKNVDEEAKLKEGERNVEGVLRRNYTISSSSTSSLAYQKNGKSEKNIERQSSRKAIQKAVKRAFSTRHSCSVNSSRYCRIYDQPKNVRDFDYNSNHDYNNGDVYDYGDNESLKQQQQHRRHDEDNDVDEYEIEIEIEIEIESNNGSMETNYTSLKKNKDDDYETNNNANANANANANGKVKVGSKVAKACKRLFSR